MTLEELNAIVTMVKTLSDHTLTGFIGYLFFAYFVPPVAWVLGPVLVVREGVKAWLSLMSDKRDASESLRTVIAFRNSANPARVGSPMVAIDYADITSIFLGGLVARDEKTVSA